MSYRIQAEEELAAGVVRIAAEQMEKALGEIADAGLPRQEQIHSVRKRCKKIRGLLRMVRPVLGECYTAENAWFRDTARIVAPMRDSFVMLKTLDLLQDESETPLPADEFQLIRNRVAEKHRRTLAGDEADAQMTNLEERLELGLQRLETWPLPRPGDFSSVADGLKKTYKRGRKGLQNAYPEPTAAQFHEWRKRTKYHWYHLRLLRDVWTRPMRARARAVKKLADLLGVHHDLHVFRDHLTRQRRELGPDAACDALLVLAQRKQRSLETEAGPLGKRIFAEKPKRLVQRFEAYWDAWTEDGHTHRAEEQQP